MHIVDINEEDPETPTTRSIAELEVDTGQCAVGQQRVMEILRNIGVYSILHLLLKLLRQLVPVLLHGGSLARLLALILLRLHLADISFPVSGTVRPEHITFATATSSCLAIMDIIL